VIRSRASERRRRLPKIAERKRKRSAAGDADSTALSVTSSSPASKPRDVSAKSKHHYRHYYEKKVKHLLKAAHILHYCSIAILGVFVIQVDTHTHTHGWRRGVVASGVRRMNEVNAQLVPGWVTVFGRLYHLGM